MNQNRRRYSKHKAARLIVVVLMLLFLRAGTRGSAVTRTQGPSTKMFVKKMAQRCGVWQIKHMTSQDYDQVSMKSNMLGFGGYSQMKF